jgi:hypothetical protein
MAEHTRGPWTLGNKTPSGDRMVFSNHGAVGKLVAYVPKHDVGKDQRDANTALIAAAPDLLAACQATLDGIDHACKHADYREARLAHADPAAGRCHPQSDQVTRPFARRNLPCPACPSW